MDLHGNLPGTGPVILYNCYHGWGLKLHQIVLPWLEVMHHLVTDPCRIGDSLCFSWH